MEQCSKGPACFLHCGLQCERTWQGAASSYSFLSLPVYRGGGSSCLCTFSRLGWFWCAEGRSLSPQFNSSRSLWGAIVKCTRVHSPERLSQDWPVNGWSWVYLLELSFLVWEKECECLYVYGFYWDNGNSPSRKITLICTHCHLYSSCCFCHWIWCLSEKRTDTRKKKRSQNIQ